MLTGTFDDVACCRLGLILFVSWFLTVEPCGAEVPRTEAFAHLPAMRDVSISPDGQFLAYLTVVDGWPAATTVERAQGGKQRIVLASDKKRELQIETCGWANATRLLCSFSGKLSPSGENAAKLPITRLVAVNADGTAMKVLSRNSSRLQYLLDWTPDVPDSVLVQFDKQMNGYPAIYEVDVYTGDQKEHTKEHAPIYAFRTDEKGVARLGWGVKGLIALNEDGRGERYSLSEDPIMRANDPDQTGAGDRDWFYFARLRADQDWHELWQFEAWSKNNLLVPTAIIPGTNKAYATGLKDGRDALWEVDLEDRAFPRVVAQHPRVDVTPLFDADGHLLGVNYETDRPATYYTNALAENVSELLKPLLPDSFVRIVDMTRDRQTFVVETIADVDPGTFYLFDIAGGNGKLQKIGAAYPDLEQAQLGRMQTIEYPASDGTRIPGYLTLPANFPPTNLPLVVMPHGGPRARTRWAFDFVAQFLVSRGYAVLQMNFRGSSGYGVAWFQASNGDWGGLAYSDIVDGARWAVARGIADPNRVGIAGWNFGGYAALLGATRNSDVFRCAVSIAGISDLMDLEIERRSSLSEKVKAFAAGADSDELQAESPRGHANRVGVPVLLIHGTRDVDVDVHQSQTMARALKRARKDYRYVEIEGADHLFSEESARITLLDTIEGFLAENLGASARAN